MLLKLIIGEAHNHTKIGNCTLPLCPSSSSFRQICLLLLDSYQDVLKFCYFAYQEFDAILYANWILFKPLNNLGLFQLLGRGTGRTLYRFARHVVSLTNSEFFGQNGLFGSRDHGSFSRESWRGVSPLMAFKPIHSRNNFFHHFQIPQRLVDTDRTLPLSRTSLPVPQCCPCLDLQHQSRILYQRRWCHQCLVSVAV